jgi:hypothetical protein
VGKGSSKGLNPWSGVTSQVPGVSGMVSGAGSQDLLHVKVITVSCIIYIYPVYCTLYTVSSIPYTENVYILSIHIELYTFSTYVRMAPPRLEQQQHVRLHALQGQGYHHLMLLS